MRTSARTDLAIRTARTGGASRFHVVVMYGLCGALALYPLLERFIAPVLVVSFMLTAVSVGARLFTNGFRVPFSFIGIVWLVYGLVYALWFFIGLTRGNPQPYVTQDSFGFLLYVGVMPILYCHIVFHRLQDNFFRFIERCSAAIGLLSVAVVAGFLLVFGEIDFDSMMMTNLFLRSLGFSWTIDHNSGVLGLYSNIAHLALLGNAIVLHRYSQHHRKKDILLLLLFLAAIVLDGRRALVITAILQLLIASPRLMSYLKPLHRLRLLVAAAGICTLLVVGNLDWIAKRFEFSDEDVSTAERYAQTPALLDKIAENPVFGGGFGTVASYIRSQERPYSYEVDLLATIMKLGAIGSLLYFGTYFYGVAQASRARGGIGVFLISAGLPFFFYMGTNGNQAMSTDSAVFHIFLFLMIAFSLPPQGRPPAPPARTAALPEA
jgi:hypothetical protein